MNPDYQILKQYWEEFLDRQALADEPLFNDFEEGHFNLLCHLFSMIDPLPGSVVECGVGYGKSLLIFSSLIKAAKTERRLWGFDSFEGFPEPSRLDASSRRPKKGEWGKSSPAMIQELLAPGVLPDHLKNVELVGGFIEDTLPKYRERVGKIALLHLDVDLYQSYKTALEILWTSVIEGGIVIFDEYRHPKWPGATIAIDDFFKDKGQAIIRDGHSQRHYLIKRLGS